MGDSKDKSEGQGTSRRDFLQASAGVSAAALLATLPSRSLFADGTDTIRVGLIGCGGRGTGAAQNCIESSEGVQIVAMADLFRDSLDSSHSHLSGRGDRFVVPEERCFVGFDAYKELLNTDVDLVILATPPAFRPMHLEAAIAAGKNVFMEKPVATDPVGIRKVIAASKMARRKGLAIVAGTQRRHQAGYIETMKRVHDGAIGELVGGQCYWNQGGLWVVKRKAGMTDMEWQCRNWLYFTWASGDHIVEQHIHNIDVLNWAFGGPPEKALSMGGRQVRTGPEYGEIFDHFATELVYPGGVRVLSECRQIGGCWNRVNEFLVGTRGTCTPSGQIRGDNPWKFTGGGRNAYVQEHADLIASIRAGEPLNEGVRVAESTLTAIMARMSAYTGKEVTFEFALNSQLSLLPDRWAFGALSEPLVAVPGQTPLI